MKKFKNIVGLVAAWLLLMAIILPSALQFGHIFEDHEHKFCGEAQIHIHNQELDCDLVLFGSSIFHIATNDLDLSSLETFERPAKHALSSLIFRKISQSQYLRGPPVFNKQMTSITC